MDLANFTKKYKELLKNEINDGTIILPNELIKLLDDKNNNLVYINTDAMGNPNSFLINGEFESHLTEEVKEKIKILISKYS